MSVYRGWKGREGRSSVYRDDTPCFGTARGWRADWRRSKHVRERQPTYGPYSVAMILLVDIGVPEPLACTMVQAFTRELWIAQFGEGWRIDTATLWQLAHQWGGEK